MSIRKVFKYNSGEQLRVVISLSGNNDASTSPKKNKFWLCGIDIATLLQYKNTSKAMRMYIGASNKTKLLNILHNNHISHKGNTKNTIYIDEIGTYRLIFNSKSNNAEEIQHWLHDTIFPNLRKIIHQEQMTELALLYKEQIESMLVTFQKEINRKDNEIQHHKDKANSIYTYQKNMIVHDKKIKKDELVYVVSSYRYMIQGIYKVGRTKNAMKYRTSGHNVTRIKGDKVIVFNTFKVNDSILIEKIVHQKLQAHLCKGEKEFFLCPYNKIIKIIEKVISCDDILNDISNDIIDDVYELKIKAFKLSDWIDRKDIPSALLDDINKNYPIEDDMLSYNDIVPVTFDTKRNQSKHLCPTKDILAKINKSLSKLQ